MKRISLLISRYLITAIVPYFVFSWLLLSVILFVQQAGRYSEIFFSINIPASLAWQLTVALVPNVIAFTCPMAILVGTIIGLTKMQGDSELVAIRAAGVGNLQIAVPIMLLGVMLSGFAFLVNLKGVPLAATLVRNVALETAIKKLESPIEPGTFNSEIAGLTIYVKSGDIVTGRWTDIFIYNEDKANGSVRLITSRNGRIDIAGEASELVLENANVTTLPIEPGAGKYVSENLSLVRFGIRTKRADLLNKLTNAELTPEELGLQQLAEYAETKVGPERVEARILWQRRVILSITPLIFCLLGTVIVLRLNRGGRGFGIFLALVVLIGFYVLAFVGEQFARVGTFDVFWSSLIPIVGSALIIIWFSYSRKINFWSPYVQKVKSAVSRLRSRMGSVKTRNLFVDLTTGLRDFDLIRNLVRHFLLTLAFLLTIFIIFTAFDLWKYAGAIDGGVYLLLNYLFFLLPFMYLQIAPSAAMIAILATYVIKSRQNEIVVWTSAGQSIYRLLLPCFLLSLFLGGVNWVMQERLLPSSNRMQDEIRNQIRNRGLPVDRTGRNWVADGDKIYAFNCASDNEKQDDLCSLGAVRDLSVYEFADNGTNLQTVYRAKNATWSDGRLTFVGPVEKNEIRDGRIITEPATGGQIAVVNNPFGGLRFKPEHVTSDELKRQAEMADSNNERASLRVAIEKKRTTLFLPFVMALFTAPFSLSLSRKGKAATVGYAVGLWLLFTGTSSVFEQLGLNGLLPPALAVWFPLVAFMLVGVFLLSRVRT